MRNATLMLVAAMAAMPSAAFAAPQAGAEPPVEIVDPAIADRMTDMAKALSTAVLALPVGEIKAAAEGREATVEDRNVTVGDLGRRDDPDFDRRVNERIAAAGPAMKAGLSALAQAVPVLMKSVGDIEQAVERAVANLPDPTYPRR